MNKRIRMGLVAGAAILLGLISVGAQTWAQENVRFGPARGRAGLQCRDGEGFGRGPANAGPACDSAERNRLQALTQQAALALAYANAYESLYELNQNLERRVKEQTARTLEDQKEITAYQERQCIARELHDSVTQKIFGMHLMARGLNAAIPGSLPKIKGEMTELETQARQVLREMRLLLNQLRNASSGEKVNLTEAIQSQCEALGGQSGPEGGPLLSVRLDAPEDIVLPSAFAEEALWVVREALQNILRHSGSRTAECCLRAGGDMRMTVEDVVIRRTRERNADCTLSLSGVR